jgi:hypothetical protein
VHGAESSSNLVTVIAWLRCGDFPLVPAQAGTQRWIPACAGMSAIECVLATRFRPSFVIHARSPDGAERNPGPIMTLHCRSRITLRSIRATKKIKREAKRRQTRRPTSVPYGHGSRKTSRARLSASRRGAYGSEPTPPLSSRRASWDAAKRRALSAPACPSPATCVADRSSCRPGVSPEPPGSGLQSRPREPRSPHVQVCLENTSR